MISAITLILSLLFGILAYLFFAPFYLEINTNTGLLRFRLHRVANISLKIEDCIYIETKVLGWSRKSALTLSQAAPATKKKEVTSHAKKKKKGLSISRAKLTSLLKSFRMNTCRISIDTGNMQWNGMLYPAFYWLGWYTGKPIEINFTGKNEVILEIQNSVARMSWALISST
jgi:hypothetical protein